MGLFDLFNKKEASAKEKFQHQDAALKVGSFNMTIEDVFTIGNNTVVTGKVTSGSIALGENVVVRENGKFAKVIGIEMFRKKVEYAGSGDNVGIFLSDVTKNDVKPGNTLIK